VEIYIVQEGGKYFGSSSYWSLSLQRYYVIDTYRPRIRFGSHLILVQSLWRWKQHVHSKRWNTL